MTHHLKALGLAIVAAFALSAVVASQAVALNTHHVTVPTAPAILTTEKDGNTAFRFTDETTQLTCETYLDGTISQATSTSITVKPEFKNCELVDGADKALADIDTNHCAFVLESDTNVAGKAGLELECAPENELTITYTIFNSKCIIHINPQTRRGLHYTGTKNGATGKNDITIRAEVPGIEYHETHSGVFCPEEHIGQDGYLEGFFTAQAYKHKGGAGCLELNSTEKTTPGDYFEKCEDQVQDLELNENVT